MELGIYIQGTLNGLLLFFHLRLTLCCPPFRFIEQGIGCREEDPVLRRIKIVRAMREILCKFH